MENKNYNKTITVNSSAENAIKKISEVIWWKKDFTGSSEKINDKFTIPFGELDGKTSYVDFKVTELIPGKKIVWKVTDCYLPWFRDKKEWKSTEVVFQLAEENGKTKINFTHIGLVPEVECYHACETGWNGHINDLAKFIG